MEGLYLVGNEKYLCQNMEVVHFKLRVWFKKDITDRKMWPGWFSEFHILETMCNMCEVALYFPDPYFSVLQKNKKLNKLENTIFHETHNKIKIITKCKK